MKKYLYLIYYYTEGYKEKLKHFNYNIFCAFVFLFILVFYRKDLAWAQWNTHLLFYNHGSINNNLKTVQNIVIGDKKFQEIPIRIYRTSNKLELTSCSFSKFVNLVVVINSIQILIKYLRNSKQPLNLSVARKCFQIVIIM